MIEKIYEEAADLYNTNNFEAAIQKYKEVLALDENVTEAWEWLGHSFLRLDDFENAALSYKRCTILEPDKIEYYQFLAEAYFFNEDYETALDEYLRFIPKDPKNNSAKIFAAKCYLFLGNGDEALKLIKKTSKLSKEDKAAKKEIHSVILTYKAYSVWPVYDEDGNRFPTSKRQYKKAKRIIEEAKSINSRETWAKSELKWMNRMLKHCKKRVFIGSWIIIVLTLIFVFFATGGVKGLSWERHKKMITTHTAFVKDIVPIAVNSLIKHKNFDDVIKLEEDEKFIEKYDDNLNGFYLLGSIWFVFLILYVISARVPLFMAQKRLKNYGKFNDLISSGVDSLQSQDTRWKTTWSDGSVSYEDDYSGTFLSLIFMGISIILTVLLLPLTVILNFFRNYVFYI